MSVQPESPQLQRLGVAAAEELRNTVRTALTALFGQFLKQLPAALTEAATKASNPADQRVCRDLAQALSSDTGPWINGLTQHVDAHFVGGVPPARASAPPASAGADDAVTLANVELRAEERYHKLITELEARVNRLRLMLYVPVYTKALAPAGLCRSLHDTADALGWPGSQRRLLFQRFDALVVPELERVYRSLIDALSRIGTAAAKATAESNAQAGTPVARPRPQHPPAAAAVAAPAEARPVDGKTLSMLESCALQADGAGYTDGLLAADLLALTDNRPLPGVAQDQSWIPLQRIALAGHFLNEVIADPMVPDELKPAHESVRYPLVKSALTDETLFTSVTHPLRSLVNELLLKSATSRITGNAETRRMAELLQQVLVQFDLSPEFVRQAMRTTTPIGETQIQRFFELQRQQAQQRREFVISEAKRIVVRQLEQATFGRGIPAPALQFLNTAWGPLLTRRLLTHGAEHTLWKAGLAWMEQLLDQLDARQPAEPPSAEWHQLLRTLGQALIAEGMEKERVPALLASLEAARRSPAE